MRCEDSFFILEKREERKSKRRLGKSPAEPAKPAPDLRHLCRGASQSSTTGGAGGIGGMNALCAESWGHLAHMCSTDEFFHSAARSSSLHPATPIWIQPSVHDCLPGATSGTIECVVTGIAGRELESVIGQVCATSGVPWTYGGGGSATGATVNRQSGATFGAPLVYPYCDLTYPVACCAPYVPEPKGDSRVLVYMCDPS